MVVSKYMFQENGEGGGIAGLLAHLKLPFAIRIPERLNSLAYHSFIKNCGGISSKFPNLPEILIFAPIFSNSHDSLFFGPFKKKNNPNPEHHDDILQKIYLFRSP